MKHEVLAPAGSFECMVAAFNAGADAVYVGGRMFGARAFANNFDKEELISAIDYTHLRGKKLFLTVNTLLKNQELKDNLYTYIKPLYEAGLDAVIVQDMGVLQFIGKNFPNMDIHASTQMTVTGSSFAKELKKYKVTRIVPARELSYDEIKSIYDATHLEIECFVHGALCYCYSGMCLLSSIIGGRSGNRGRCAQPCRLPYDVIFNDKTIKDSYPLSPKDLCTLEILPKILEAGVYSLKIEGRMKKPEYVASVTAMYRKYVDLYEQKGEKGYKVAKEDIIKLKDIYNRGGFTTGYYERHNGSEIMSLDRPNHMGIVAAKLIAYDMTKDRLKAKALADISSSDVLEIFINNSESIYIKASNISKGNEFFVDKNFISIKGDTKSKKNYVKLKALLNKNIMRTRNNNLISNIEEAYIKDNSKSQVKICGSVVIEKNKPIILKLFKDDISVSLTGSIPEAAANRPTDEKDVRKQISKTGGTDFFFTEDSLQVSVDDGLFVNIKELNSLRREALEQLKHEFLNKFRRAIVSEEAEISNTNLDISKNAYESDNTILTNVLVSSIEQFKEVLQFDYIDNIYVEMDIVNDLSKELSNLIEAAHNNKKGIYIALPYILRTHGKNIIKKHLEFFKNNSLDGFVFRNMESIYFFEELNIEYKNCIFDNSMYTFNDESVSYFKTKNPKLITASYELNAKELAYLNNDVMEVNVYGYIPVMISAGCVKKSYNRCDGKKEVIKLNDRTNSKFTVINNCSFCYNIMYNTKPLLLCDMINHKGNIECKAIRYNFVFESKEEVKRILNGQYISDITKGHFKRGVE